MTLYARLVSRFPKPVVDLAFVLVQAAVFFLVVVYSDQPAAAFSYLRL